MKLWKIKNILNGLEFQVADGREELGDLQPEWGENPEISVEEVPSREEVQAAKKAFRAQLKADLKRPASSLDDLADRLKRLSTLLLGD